MRYTRSRRVSPSQLSFLDIMCCGFGAVVLLVLLLTRSALQSDKEGIAEQEVELARLEVERLTYEKQLEKINLQHSQVAEQLNSLTLQVDEIYQSLNSLETQGQTLRDQNEAIDTQNTSLAVSISEASSQKRQLEDSQKTEMTKRNSLQSFVGDGNRQYLTGLKLGGKRTLILLDSSTSMLDRRLVNILRTRVLDDETKKMAAKWKRAKRSVQWLVANLPLGSGFHIATFSDTAQSLLPEQANSTWTQVSEFEQVNTLLGQLDNLVPDGGTSLVNAFTLAKSLSPAPDNIILLTDSLPTRGRSGGSSRSVSGERRLQLFEQAVRVLPQNIPVNILLFPMEGDLHAAVSFWSLAIQTRGSFMTPSKDWP